MYSFYHLTCPALMKLLLQKELKNYSIQRKLLQRYSRRFYLLSGYLVFKPYCPKAFSSFCVQRYQWLFPAKEKIRVIYREWYELTLTRRLRRAILLSARKNLSAYPNKLPDS